MAHQTSSTAWKLAVLLLSALVALCAISVASATVLGVDFGADTVKVAALKPGSPIDIVLNEQSKRKTPALIAFKDGERYIGEAALNLFARIPATTFGNLKNLVGRQYDPLVIEEFRSLFLPYLMTNNTQRGTFDLLLSPNPSSSNDETNSYSPEELLAMMYQYIGETASRELSQPVKDVAVAIPPYYTQQQRLAVKSAVEISGLRLLALVPEHIATAVQYGLSRRSNFDASKPHSVIFYDMGAGALKVSIASFFAPSSDAEAKEKLGRIDVRALAYDSTLGGTSFDICLANRFAREFSQQHPSVSPKITSNAKSMARLRREAQKIKEVLSANTEMPVVIESLHDDRDLRSFITRAEFESECGSLFERAMEPLKNALESSGIPLDQIYSVELMGGASRTPYLQKSIAQLVKMEASRSLNADEAIALGATFIAAKHSPGVKVKDFIVSDLIVYPISFKLNSDSNKRTLFAEGTHPPSKKAITLNRNSSNVTVTLMYDSTDNLLPGTSLVLGEYSINGIAEAEDQLIASSNSSSSSASSNSEFEKGKVKIQFKLDESGIVHLESSSVSVEQTIVVSSDSNNSTSTASSPSSDSESDSEEATEPAAAAAAATSEKKTQKKVLRSALKHIAREGGSVQLLNQTGVVAATRRLQALKEYDLEKQRLAAVRNELEAFIYSTRDKATEDKDFLSVSNEEQRSALLQEVAAADEWMEEEGYDASLRDYKQKLDKLKKLADPILLRSRELTERPAAVQNCHQMLNSTRFMIKEKWITAMPYSNETERGDVLKMADEIENWLEAKLEEQSKKEAHDAELAVDSAEISKECSRVMKRVVELGRKAAPRPSPKPKPAPKDNNNKKNKTATASASSEQPAADKKQAEASQQEQTESTPQQTEQQQEQKHEEL